MKLARQQQAHPAYPPFLLCQPHSSSQHSKDQLCWNEFNPQVSTVTHFAHLTVSGGAEAWLMIWPLHGPRMTSSWGSRHLARRNSQRDVKVLPSEAHRGFRGDPLHSMLHSLSWSTRRNCTSKKVWDKQRKHLLNEPFLGISGQCTIGVQSPKQEVWFCRNLRWLGVGANLFYKKTVYRYPLQKSYKQLIHNVS